MKDLKINLKFLKVISVFLFLFLIISCDSNKFDKTPIENFIGTWQLEGRSMFSGIKVKIEKNLSGELYGKVIEINDNKYVNMFLEPGDIWISGITRNSNFEFELTEKKLGSALFSIYDLSTTSKYKVQFIDKDIIGLGTKSKDPLNSSVKYIRVNE